MVTLLIWCFSLKSHVFTKKNYLSLLCFFSFVFLCWFLLCFPRFISLAFQLFCSFACFCSCHIWKRFRHFVFRVTFSCKKEIKCTYFHPSFHPLIFFIGMTLSLYHKCFSRSHFRWLKPCYSRKLLPTFLFSFINRRPGCVEELLHHGWSPHPAEQKTNSWQRGTL